MRGGCGLTALITAGLGIGVVAAEGDAGFAQIIGRHLHLDPVTDAEADKVLAHFSGDVGKDLMLVIELDAEHSSFHHALNGSFNLD